MNKHETRIYVVADSDGHERLVRTSHRAYAMQYVTKTTFKVRVANQTDLERLLPCVAVESYSPRTPKGGDAVA